MAEPTLKQIQQAKAAAQTDIANYISARLARLAKESGIQPRGLSVSAVSHGSRGRCDGLLITDVSIAMGGI